MPKVSDEHKAAVRRRILDAALACLERNGYRDVTTREVLSEAGLSTGTFYNYFASKEELYEALAQEALTADIERILAGSGEGTDMAEALLSFLGNLAFTETPGAVAVATFRGRMHAEPEAAAAIARLNAWVVAAFTPLVERAQAEGSVRQDLDVPALVELIDIVWDGLGRRAATGSFQTGYRRVGAVLMELLSTGLSDQAPGEVSSAATSSARADR